MAPSRAWLLRALRASAAIHATRFTLQLHDQRMRPTFSNLTSRLGLGISHATLATFLGALLGADVVSAQIGTPYCAANTNSTGVTSVISASGSTDVAQNNVTLACASLPLNSFGFFIVSRLQAFVANPGGSSGNLCLGGSIGRYSLSVLNAGALGQVSLPINLTSIPHPTTPFAVVAGDTLNFQYWHRDGVPGSPATSNFSRGLEIVFTTAPPTPSFLNAVYPLLELRNSLGFSCVDCHDGSTCDIDLSTAPVAYAGLVNVASSASCTCSGTIYVVPGNSAGSLLYQKLTNPTCGNMMPLVGTFPGDVNIIRDWIDGGAPNN
jgi:hypothetical protein